MIAAKTAAFAQDTVARDDKTDGITTNSGANGPVGPGLVNRFGQISIGHTLSGTDLQQALPDAQFKVRSD